MMIQSNQPAAFALTGLVKEKNPAENGVSLKKEKDGEDFVIKNLQEQINSLRTKLQEIGENRDLDEKGKAELKQTLQAQITELNSRLEQRRIELRQEKLAKEREKAEEKDRPAISERPNRDRFMKNDRLSGLVSASDAIEAAKTCQKAGTKKERDARILEREAGTDARAYSRVEIVGYRFRNLAERFAAERDIAKEAGDPNKMEETGNFELGLSRSPIFGKIFEKRSGSAAEKLEAAAILSAEAVEAEKNAAEKLSEANEELGSDERNPFTDRT